MGKIIYVSLILLLLFSCGPKKGEVDKVKKYVEDGIEVIENPLDPVKIKGESTLLNLKEEFTIDTEKEEIAEKGLTDIWGFNVDSKGNIFLLNSRSSEDLIYKFDKEGKYISSFGEKGKGPGELQSPHCPVIHQKEIVISDELNHKISYFTTEGTFLRENQLGPNVKKVHPLDGRKYILIKQEATKDPKYMKFHVILADSEFSQIKILYSEKFPNLSLVERANGLNLIPDATYFYPLVTSNRNIYIRKNKKEYEIRVYDFEGNLIRKIRKEYQPVKISEEFKEKILKRYERIKFDSKRDGIFL